MRVLLTGANGFIGAHVAQHMTERGVEVIGFSRSQPPPWARLRSWVQGDVTDAESVRHAVHGVDAVVHCAALYSYSRSHAQAMQQTNVQGTRNVCQAALREGVQRVLLTSTSATCGPVPGRAATEADRPPQWELSVPYKRTKLEAETLAFSFIAEGLDVVSVNPTTVVGAFDIKPTPSGKMVRDLVEGRIRAYVRGAGINVVSVRDVAAGHMLALMRGKAGERYILGGQDLELGEAFAHAATAAGLSAPRIAIPWSIPYTLARADDLVRRLIGGEPGLLVLDEVKLARYPLFFSSEKASRQLGYAPGSGLEALEEAARWFAARCAARSRANWRTKLAPSGRESMRSGGRTV